MVRERRGRGGDRTGSSGDRTGKPRDAGLRLARTTPINEVVKEGQQVEVGQVLCILEAMKMKNPIRATHPGTVSEVCVEVGRTVPYGEVLIRLA